MMLTGIPEIGVSAHVQYEFVLNTDKYSLVAKISLTEVFSLCIMGLVIKVNKKFTQEMR